MEATLPNTALLRGRTLDLRIKNMGDYELTNRYSHAKKQGWLTIASRYRRALVDRFGKPRTAAYAGLRQ